MIIADNMRTAIVFNRYCTSFRLHADVTVDRNLDSLIIRGERIFIFNSFNSTAALQALNCSISSISVHPAAAGKRQIQLSTRILQPASPNCTISNSQVNLAGRSTGTDGCYRTNRHNIALKLAKHSGNRQIQLTAVINNKIAFYSCFLIELVNGDFRAITDDIALDGAIAQSNLCTLCCNNSILCCRIITLIIAIDISLA